MDRLENVDTTSEQKQAIQHAYARLETYDSGKETVRVKRLFLEILLRLARFGSEEDTNRRGARERLLQRKVEMLEQRLITAERNEKLAVESRDSWRHSSHKFQVDRDRLAVHIRKINELTKAWGETFEEDAEQKALGAIIASVKAAARAVN
jgi:hypothetical protein